MPDFQRYVRNHLCPVGLSRNREAEVVEEIAEHMRMSYEEARARGETESEALAFAESSFVPWERLRRNIELTEKTPPPEAGREGGDKSRVRRGCAKRIRTMVEGLWQDVRFASRTLRRSPGFTFVTLATLALGIGATTAMVSVLDAALRRDLPFPQAGRLVLGRGTWDGHLGPYVSYPNYMDYRDQARSFESLATIFASPRSATITGSDDPQQVNFLSVSSNLFETLGVNPHLGRPFTLDELSRGGGGEVVISHGLWERWFGEAPDAVGRTLSVNGNHMTVVGVMPAGFRLWFDVDLWLPPPPGEADPSSRRYTNWFLVGRLATDATLAAARSEVDLISEQLADAYPETNRGMALQLDGLREATVEGYQQSLLLLMGAMLLVLLIACGNVANLLLARGSTRTCELAVRAAMGAARPRLTRQLLVECVILAVSAGALGVVLAIWLQELILRFVSMDLLGMREVGLSFTMLGMALGLSLGTVLLFGLFPSLAAARANPAVDLKEGRRGVMSRRGIRYRSGLVIFQVALSLILLLSAGLLIRSFAKLTAVDPGFRVENLLTASISLPADRYPTGESASEFLWRLKEEIEVLPGVETVGMVNRLPILQTAGNMRIWTPGTPHEETLNAPLADLRAVLPGYFEAMGIPLLEGRALEEADRPGSPRVVVLNRTTAEVVFRNESPVGHQVAVDVGAEEPAFFQVVGVVEDHVLSSLSGSRRLAAFFPYAQNPRRTMRLAVATANDPKTLIRSIQERIWELDRDIVLGDPLPMEDVLSNSVAGRRSVATLLGMFATAATSLAALGLFGVLSYFVTQRTHEIGIRVALGARGVSVLQLVLSRGMLLVGAGSVLGLAGALGATRLLEGMLFQMSPIDSATYAGAVGLFLIVAVGACVLPAWRATRVDPVEAFRAE